MTAAAPERPRSATETVACAACRIMLSPDLREAVPSVPGLWRCKDEEACRKRYAPRRLSRSLRGEDRP